MKKRKRIDKISLRAPAVWMVCLVSLFFAGCETSTTVEVVVDPHQVPYNPSQPVVITDFTPESGSVGSQIIIEGSNFGSDVSIIKAFIDDVPLNVIGSDGNQLYAALGAELSDNEDKGVLTVYVGEGENEQEATIEKRFRYIILPFVSSVAGWIDERTGDSPSADGDIDKAQFGELHWLAFDQEKNLYILEERGGVRFIDKDFTHVSTKFRVSGRINRLRTISFTKDYKQMYITNDDDNSEWNGVGAIIATDEDDFTSWTEIINSRYCNGGDINPISGTFFFGSYEQGQVLKWHGLEDPENPSGRPAYKNYTELFKLQDRDWEFNIQFEPNGEFAYFVAINKHFIQKAKYNKENDELETPAPFVGTAFYQGHRDGVATTAVFWKPYQGTFDEVGNFYICDSDNHVIRKITPNGIVSTFAGRVQTPGYTNGALRDAQFRHPQGIVYDSENKVFYIADRGNKRLRKITMPKNQ